MDHKLHVDGGGSKSLRQKAGGSLHPPTYKTIDAKEHFLFQDGQPVFKAAVKGMADVSYEIMQRNKLAPEDVDWLVPHQANLRIIDATQRRMGLPHEKVTINIQKYGNTTAATIPLCLVDWERKFKKGDNIILAAFGGGFTWGAVYLKWAYDTPEKD
jgi:3-oxoacyl-[acyl-carrier-protein] synthase-3